MKNKMHAYSHGPNELPVHTFFMFESYDGLICFGDCDCDCDRIFGEKVKFD